MVMESPENPAGQPEVRLWNEFWGSMGSGECGTYQPDLG